MDEKLKKEIREHKFRVFLEPELEKNCGTMTPAERRCRAAVHRRMARQLEVSAALIETQAKVVNRDPLRPLHRRRLALN